MKIFTFCSTVMMGIFSCCCYATQLEQDNASETKLETCEDHLQGITQIGDKIESKKIDAVIITRQGVIDRNMGLVELYRRPVASLKSAGKFGYMQPQAKVKTLKNEYNALIQDVFGVDENWTLDQVKKSFRKLALICHPDKLMGCNDEVTALGEETYYDLVILVEIAEQLKVGK